MITRWKRSTISDNDRNAQWQSLHASVHIFIMENRDLNLCKQQKLATRPDHFSFSGQATRVNIMCRDHIGAYLTENSVWLSGGKNCRHTGVASLWHNPLVNTTSRTDSKYRSCFKVKITSDKHGNSLYKIRVKRPHR